MTKIGNNDPCPCGSTKKFKKCCRNKRPREQIVMVGSSEPLHGLHYDKDKMKFMGVTLDDRLIEPKVTFSQSHYIGQSGKEKVLSRVHDKVIPNQADLLKHLSSFDLIIGIDTNTKIIEDEHVSASYVVHYVIQKTSDPNKYYADILQHGAYIFRNCPSELHSEKFGWITVIKNVNCELINRQKQIAIVTDHDLDNHTSYNNKKISIFGDFYLPENFKLLYGKGDGPNQNTLNYIIKMCDKESSKILKEFEKRGSYQQGDKIFLIKQLPTPKL